MAEVALTEEPAKEETDDFVHRFVAVLIIVVTLIGAVFAFLQTRAGDEESVAQRSAQQQAVATMSALVEQNRRYSIDAQSYDFTNDEDWFRHEYLLQSYDGGPAGAYAGALSAAHGAVAKALASYRAQIFGPKYRGRDGKFQYAAFAEDQAKPLYRAGELGRAYSLQRDGWGDKGDRFVTVITVLAVSLFLLGLTLTVPGGARMLFLGMGSAVALAATIWGLVIWSERVPVPNERAIAAFVNGQSKLDVAELVDGNEARRAKFEGARRDLTRAIGAEPDYTAAYLSRGDTAFRLDFLNPAGPRGAPSARDDWKRSTGLDPSNFVGWGNLGAAQFWLGEYEDALASNERALRIRPTNDTFTLNKALYLSVLRRNEDYAAELRRVRSVLAGEPSWLRNFTVTRYEDLVFQGARYRPRIETQINRFRDDLREIDGEIDASLRTLGRPRPAPTRARMDVPRFELSADRTELKVHLGYRGMTKGARWLYDTTVDGVRSDTFSFGPKRWAFATPDGGVVLTFTRGAGWKRSAVVRTEVFVDGNLLAQREYAVP